MRGLSHRSASLLRTRSPIKRPWCHWAAGAGERLLEACGFLDIRRVEVPFAWEFADPETFARALASSGPAYEAIQNVGEQAFHDAAVDQAREHMRDGLPLRAEINVVGYLARKPEEDLQP